MKAKRLKLQSSFIQKNAKVFLFCFLLFIFIIPAKSQITIDNTKTNAQLVAQLLGSGVSASNVVFRGVRNVSTRYQVGAFSTATSTLAQMGFTGGVVLSTGNISDIPLALGTNPGTVGQMSYNYISGTTGEIRQSNPVAGQDADADNLVNVNYYNAAILEFDFVPVGDAVSFRYVFGSEEYSDQGGSINYQCSSYNDKFAFLISGPGIVGGQGYTNNARNIARLNNGAEVGINSVNGGVVGSSGGAPSAANCEAASLTAWVQNSPSAEYLGHIDGTELNGNTRILTASQTGLTPGGTYHIRLLVSDAQDGAYDAVVYIEAGSFTSPTATLTTSATPSTICSGNSTYAKTVVASGTAPYNYTWSNGVTHLNSPNPTDSILVSPGSTTTYTVTVVDNHLPTATTSVGSVTVTVTPLPTASISYTGSPFCTSVSPVSVNLTGTNAYTGGTYTASPGLTINASSGLITPSSSTAGGPYTVTYTIAASGGCTAVTANSNVSISSPVSQTISGVSQLCNGLTNTFSVSPTTGGTWSSSVPGVATVNSSTGLVTSVSAGSTIISYSVTTGGCVNNATQNLTITSPVSQSITGVSQLCIGSTNTFTNSPTVGGAWTSSVPGFATVNSSTGLVTGISAGTSLITYSVTTSGGCVNTATQNVTISAPVSQTITGVSQLCNGLTNSFSVSPSSGGTWASSATGVATVNSSTGLVTGISSGSTNITYTVTTTGGCVNTATQSLTITNPVSQTITGASQICSGATANYTISPTTGGIWSSGTTGVATINSTSGLILAVSSGTSTITYSVTTSGGCVNTATQTLTVNPLPNVTATSNVTLNSVCNGGNVTLTGGGANSYSWSGGITNGVSFTPTTTNTYTVIGTDINTCQNNAQITVTVNSLPNISISGLSLNNPTACLGTDGQITGITVTGAPTIQYSWNGGANQLSPNLTGVSAGAYTLVATDGNGCVSSVGPYSLSDPGAPAAPTINILAGPVCEGSPFTISINNPNALASYSWTGPSGSLGTGTSITISNASLSDAGSYSTQSTLSGCTGSSSSTTVTVTTLPTSSISYFTPFCSSNTNAQSVSQVGTGGGVFSSNIAGLTLNTSNGEITPSSSTAGTYIVTYTIAAAGGCAAVTAKDTIEITLLPTANIIYNGSPFCSDLTAIQNVNLTGTIGGAYSAPAGLTLNTTNGEVTPNTSIAGNYSVTYQIPAANGCPLVSSTTAVTITTLPTANISYNGPFCSSEVNAQSVNLTGNSGGIYSSTLGLNLNLTTGSINPGLSTAGNYNVIYTISSSAGCPAVISTSNVTITELPVAAISYNGPFCSSLVTEQAVSLTGNNGGVYTAPLGLNINSGSGSINPGLSTAGNYNITYTIASSGGCPSVNAISNVTITTLPSASISYAGSPFCTNNNNLQSVIFTGTTGGLYTSTSGLNIEANTGSINPSLSNEGNYIITYTIAASGGCSDVTSNANIEIVKSVLPVTVFNYNTPVCSNGSNPIPLTIANFTSGGAYTSTSGLNLDVNSGVINLANTIPGTYSVIYSIAQSGCMLAGITTSTITIDQTITPVTGFIYEIPECVDASKPNPITNSGFTIGGSYSSLPSGLTIDAITGEINLLSSIPGIYSVSYSIASNGCSLAGNSNDDVNINREGCLNIPTAFSPNNDGVNDTWEIEHINLYAEVSIEIYNRWGQLMFEFSGTGDSYADIDNQWNGKYEGKDLPINSFIFIVNLYNDKEPIQGIVTIVK